eukprot:4764863-Prymnesium_polylepis.1
MRGWDRARRCVAALGAMGAARALSIPVTTVPICFVTCFILTALSSRDATCAASLARSGGCAGPCSLGYWAGSAHRVHPTGEFQVAVALPL